MEVARDQYFQYLLDMDKTAALSLMDMESFEMLKSIKNDIVE